MTLKSVRVLHSDTEHLAALAEYEGYFDAEPAAGSEAADRFELLGLVIADYEARRWPIEPADPVDVIRLVMEGRGYDQADLATLLGSRSRASEVLNGQRPLSLAQIRVISAAWKVPAQALIGVARAA